MATVDLALLASVTLDLVLPFARRPIDEPHRLAGGTVRRPVKLHKHLYGLLQRLAAAAAVGWREQHHSHLFVHAGRLHVGERPPDDAPLATVVVLGAHAIGVDCVRVDVGQLEKAHSNVLFGHLVAQNDQLLGAGARAGVVADVVHGQIDFGLFVVDGVGEQRRQGDQKRPAGLRVGMVDKHLKADA